MTLKTRNPYGLRFRSFQTSTDYPEACWVSWTVCSTDKTLGQFLLLSFMQVQCLWMLASCRGTIRGSSSKRSFLPFLCGLFFLNQQRQWSRSVKRLRFFHPRALCACISSITLHCPWFVFNFKIDRHDRQRKSHKKRHRKETVGEEGCRLKSHRRWRKTLFVK